MTRKPAPPPAPVALDTLAQIRAAVEHLAGGPLSAAERLAVLRLLAAIVPDEEQGPVRAELVRLFPTIRGTRDKLKALALAAELLPAESRPKSFGERVLLAMADA